MSPFAAFMTGMLVLSLFYGGMIGYGLVWVRSEPSRALYLLAMVIRGLAAGTGYKSVFVKVGDDRVAIPFSTLAISIEQQNLSIYDKAPEDGAPAARPGEEQCDGSA